MVSARITLKNYRAFTDSEPLRIEIDDGFTAIVGPNNVGKSAFKNSSMKSGRCFRYYHLILSVC